MGTFITAFVQFSRKKVNIFRTSLFCIKTFLHFVSLLEKVGEALRDRASHGLTPEIGVNNSRNLC